MKKLFVAGVMLAIAGFAAGCATQSTKKLASPAGDADQSGREDHVRHLQHWSLAGRLSISDGKTGGPMDFNWQEDGETFDFAMNAPGVAVQLHESPKGAVVTGAKGGPRYGTDTEHIMQQLLGWDVPVRDLRAWVLGLRAPGEVAQCISGQTSCRIS